MPLARQDEHVESLVGADQGIHDTDGVGRMHIVVDVPVHEEKVPLEVAGDFRIGVYVIDKCRVPLFCYLFEYAVVLLAPPAVVDAVVMVSCAGYGSGVEVRIFQDGCSGHESSSGMPVYPDLGAVNPRILCGKPLHGSLLVFKPVVAEIAIAVVVIPFGPVRMSSAVAHGNYYEAHLCQPVRAGHSCAP